MARNRSTWLQFRKMMQDFEPYIRLWKESRVTEAATAAV